MKIRFWNISLLHSYWCFLFYWFLVECAILAIAYSWLRVCYRQQFTKNGLIQNWSRAKYVLIRFQTRVRTLGIGSKAPLVSKVKFHKESIIVTVSKISMDSNILRLQNVKTTITKRLPKNMRFIISIKKKIQFSSSCMCSYQSTYVKIRSWGVSELRSQVHTNVHTYLHPFIAFSLFGDYWDRIMFLP